jgi:hypothetical protein
MPFRLYSLWQRVSIARHFASTRCIRLTQWLSGASGKIDTHAK